MNSYFHAVSSAKRFGGEPEEYLNIHEWIDGSKVSIGDPRHRALRHHTQGVWTCQEIFGRVLVLNTGRKVPVREIAERHIIEDLGWLPSFTDYIENTPIERWMGGKQRKVLPLSTLNLEEPA